MTESVVKISMRDDNDLNCSYAIVFKGSTSVIIVLKDSECAIFDYEELKKQDYTYKYLLLKHYSSDSNAYKDFLKLIGKMCKKEENSKYFRNHKKEDNRMIWDNLDKEHNLSEEEKMNYEKRFVTFKEFIMKNRDRF